MQKYSFKRLHYDAYDSMDKDLDITSSNTSYTLGDFHNWRKTFRFLRNKS